MVAREMVFGVLMRRAGLFILIAILFPAVALASAWTVLAFGCRCRKRAASLLQHFSGCLA
jgi:hypothetical protein